MVIEKQQYLLHCLMHIILLISIGAIGYEAVHHLFNPPVLPGFTIAWVAGIGIIINGVTAFMFLKNKEEDLNIKAAYLHLLSDALVSLALVTGGIIIYYTKWFWIDPVLSLIIAIVIIKSTWSLLKSSLRLSLDAVPENVDIKKIEKNISAIDGVENIHHIHAWAIKHKNECINCTYISKQNLSMKKVDELKHTIKHELEHLNIHHSTLEFEQNMHDCKKETL